MGTYTWLEWQVADDDWVDARTVAKKSEKYLKRQDVWERLVERFSYDKERVKQVNRVLLVTAVKPTIVLIGEGSTHYHLEYFGGGTQEHQIGKYGQLASAHKGRGGVLPYGFRYGTKLPYTPDPEWFSPDLKVGPKPVRVISPNEGRIDVAWGELVLSRRGDQWVVTTAADDK